MIDGRIYLNEETGTKVRTKKLMEDERFEYWDIDVVSYGDVTVEELVHFFMKTLNPKTKGTIRFIDGTEQTMDEGMNGQNLCSYYGTILSYISQSKADVFERFIRFATVKISKISGCEIRNLILFVPQN